MSLSLKKKIGPKPPKEQPLSSTPEHLRPAETVAARGNVVGTGLAAGAVENKDQANSKLRVSGNRDEVTDANGDLEGSRSRRMWIDAMEMGEDIKHMLQIVPMNFVADAALSEDSDSGESEAVGGIDVEAELARDVVEGIRAQSALFESVKGQMNHVVEEVNDLMLGIQSNAILTETIEEDREALKRELEHIRVLFRQKAIRLEGKLETLRTLHEQEEVRTQSIANNMEALQKIKVALERKLSKARARYLKEIAQMKNQIRNARNQRDEYELRARRISEDTEALKEENSALSSEIQHVRTLYGQDVERLIGQTEKLRNTHEQQRVFTLRANRVVEEMEGVKLENVALEHKLQNLTIQRMGADPLGKELHALKAERDRVRKERDILRLRAEESRERRQHAQVWRTSTRLRVNARSPTVSPRQGISGLSPIMSGQQDDKTPVATGSGKQGEKSPVPTGSGKTVHKTPVPTTSGQQDDKTPISTVSGEQTDSTDLSIEILDATLHETRMDRLSVVIQERHKLSKYEAVLKERDDLRREVESLRRMCSIIPMLRMQVEFVKEEYNRLKRRKAAHIRVP
jgi:hypothetical protein